ncbi:hypothetical protein C8J57DRAFT_1458771 [Mycena rebaudengoi]|nr:hypothetical protein C8J57DRAFT_1458771 [Mycena rebaudengoi]
MRATFNTVFGAILALRVLCTAAEVTDEQLQCEIDQCLGSTCDNTENFSECICTTPGLNANYTACGTSKCGIPSDLASGINDAICEKFGCLNDCSSAAFKSSKCLSADDQACLCAANSAFQTSFAACALAECKRTRAQFAVDLSSAVDRTSKCPGAVALRAANGGSIGSSGSDAGSSPSSSDKKGSAEFGRVHMCTMLAAVVFGFALPTLFAL